MITVPIEFTPTSAITSVVNSISRFGNLIDISLSFTLVNGLDYGNSIVIGSIPSKYSHDTNIFMTSVGTVATLYGVMLILLDTTGVITLYASTGIDIPSGSQISAHNLYFSNN